MKKLLFIATLFSCFAFTTKAQNLTNLTNCDIIIKQLCYDASCTIVSATVTTLVPGQTAPTTSCAPFETVYEVCWLNPPCTTTNPCAFVSADNPMGPCGPGTYTASITACPGCANGPVATIVVDPTTGDLTVFP